MSVATTDSNVNADRGESVGALAWAAFAIALLTLGGSIFLSLGLNLKACPLCYYQRTFAMSLVAVLGAGLLLHGGAGLRISLLALPMAIAGLGVAAFHEFLEFRGTLECPIGLLGIGTAPQQSLAMFMVLFAILALDVALQGRWAAFAGALAIGLVLAVASCTTNPPMPAAPSQPYPTEPKICRPPFRSPNG
jgi:disulfide bond formation protein DsbB